MSYASDYTAADNVARKKMWDILLADVKSGGDRKNDKNKFAKQFGLTPSQITPENYMQYMEIPCHPSLNAAHTISFGHLQNAVATLGNCQEVTQCVSLNDLQCHPAPTKEVNLMYNDCDDYCCEEFSKEKSAQAHLISRSNEINWAKEDELRKQFYLRADPDPKTANDLIARITSGKFIIEKGKEDKETYAPLNYFEWRDPAHPADRPGFDAASKILEAKMNEVIDTIKVFPAEQGLKAIQEFAAWTPTAATTTAQ